MAIDAQKFIDNAEQFLPGVELAARLLNLKIVQSLAAVMKRATEHPETKEQVIAWLRWLPVFEGDTAGTPEPLIPNEYADIREDLIEIRNAIQAAE